MNSVEEMAVKSVFTDLFITDIQLQRNYGIGRDIDNTKVRNSRE